jgi:hypothetical protein
MSERDKKKKKCDDCQVPNFTKYDCRTCDGEYCSDCTNLKPADCKVILSYCGYWECKACKELPEHCGCGREEKATGEQGKEELIARLVSMVQKLVDRMEEMENKLTAKVEMMGREMLQRDEKMHERAKVTVPVATYATAAAQNAGPGGTVKLISSEEPMAVEQERLKERRLNIIVRGVEEHPNPEEAGFIKKAYDIEQVAIIANIKVPGFSINEYKEAMQQCFRLGKDNTHTKRPIKVVFKTGHEEVRDGLIGGSLMLSQVNKEQGTLFRIQEDLTMNQQKLYRNAWAEAGKRSKSGDEEEWTVVGPKSQPRLLLKRRLDEGKRTSRVERKELEKKKLAEVPPTALQNNLVMMAAKRAREIQDAEDAEREEHDAVG